MRKEQLPIYAVALAVLIVGLAALGVPSSLLLILPLLVACPLMMMSMMRGMDHGGMTHGQRDAAKSVHPSGAGSSHDHSISAEQPTDAAHTNHVSRR